MMPKQPLKRLGLWVWIAGMISAGLAWHFKPTARDTASMGNRRVSQHTPPEQGGAAAGDTQVGKAGAQSEAALKGQVEFLSRQVTDLKTQADQAERAALRAHRALRDAQGKLAQALKPLEQEMFSSALRTKVEPEHTVITGGYEVPGGGIEYTMFKPTLMTQDGKQIIMVEAKVMRVQKEHAASLGLDSLQTNADNTLQHGEVWNPAQTGKFDSTLKTLDGGFDVLYCPRVTVSNGQEAMIEIGNYKATLRASVPEEGGAIQIDLRTEQRKAGNGEQP
jgi:hypothetical protein